MKGTGGGRERADGGACAELPLDDQGRGQAGQHDGEDDPVAPRGGGSRGPGAGPGRGCAPHRPARRRGAALVLLCVAVLRLAVLRFVALCLVALCLAALCLAGLCLAAEAMPATLMLAGRAGSAPPAAVRARLGATEVTEVGGAWAGAVRPMTTPAASAQAAPAAAAAAARRPRRRRPVGSKKTGPAVAASGFTM